MGHWTCPHCGGKNRRRFIYECDGCNPEPERMAFTLPRGRSVMVVAPRDMTPAEADYITGMLTTYKAGAATHEPAEEE